MDDDRQGGTATDTERNRERRLRRAARRQGFHLHKRRGTVANWAGPNYMLLDAYYGTAVLHDLGCYWNRVTLDEVERFLEEAGKTGGEETRKSK